MYQHIIFFLLILASYCCDFIAGKSSHLAEEIAARRFVARNPYYNPEEYEQTVEGCAAEDLKAPFLRPRDERNAGAPCDGQGVVVRRDSTISPSISSIIYLVKIRLLSSIRNVLILQWDHLA